MVSYNVINECNDIIDGEFDSIETAQKYLKLIIEQDIRDYPDDTTKFFIEKITRETLE